MWIKIFIMLKTLHLLRKKQLGNSCLARLPTRSVGKIINQLFTLEHSWRPGTAPLYHIQFSQCQNGGTLTHVLHGQKDANKTSFSVMCKLLSCFPTLNSEILIKGRYCCLVELMIWRQKIQSFPRPATAFFCLFLASNSAFMSFNLSICK